MILDGNCLYLNCRERPPCRWAGCPHATTAPRRIRTEFPNSLPRGVGGAKGRVRNAGGNMKVSKKRTDLHPSRSSGGGLQIFIIVRLPPAFLISHQSVPKSRLATARNCGVIAPGNHWIYDSLRGAPPPGEAFRCFRTSASVYGAEADTPGGVSLHFLLLPKQPYSPSKNRSAWHLLFRMTTCFPSARLSSS